VEAQTYVAVAQLDLAVEGLVNHDVVTGQPEPFVLSVDLEEAIAPPDCPIVLDMAWFLPPEHIVKPQPLRQPSVQVADFSGPTSELPVQILQERLMQIFIGCLDVINVLQSKSFDQAILKYSVSTLYPPFGLRRIGKDQLNV
jgi:hypothetical protein